MMLSFLTPTMAIPVLSTEQLVLLKKLEAAHQLGAQSREFKGTDRTIAESLGRLGFAECRGFGWVRSFWSITDAGREFLATNGE